MSTINFSSGTVITSDWLNDVDATVYEGILNTKVKVTASTISQAAITVNQTNTGGVIEGNKYTNDTLSSTIDLTKSRGVAVDSHVVVQSGDDLGGINFKGSDGTAYITAGRILVECDGTPGTNDMPGRLLFSTTADGSATPTERMRINSRGEVGIGVTPTLGYSFYVGKNLTGATATVSGAFDGTIQSDSTVSATYCYTYATTAAASFTVPTLSHFRAAQGTIGAGSVVTNQYGFYTSSTLTGATNNYGFYSNLGVGTGIWGFYSAGTAANHFAGATTFSTSFGYATGSGSSVVQATSKSTPVTLNTICGQITMNAAELLNTVGVAFTLNNNKISSTDVVVVNISSGATAGVYSVTVDAIGSGSCSIHIRNNSITTAYSEALVLNFAVIKAVAS